MAQVSLEIGGRRYDLACRDGEEPHLRALGAMVDSRVAEASRAVGGGNETRQLLMAALLLADELGEAREGAPVRVDPALTNGLAALGERLEALATRLENADEAS